MAYKTSKAPDFSKSLSNNPLTADQSISKDSATKNNNNNNNSSINNIEDNVAIGLLSKLFNFKTNKRKSLRGFHQADLIELSKLFGLQSDLKCAVMKDNLKNVASEDIIHKHANICSYNDISNDDSSENV
jgi:hypothetical protein